MPKYKFDQIAKEVKRRRQAAVKSENFKLQTENEHLKMQHKLIKLQMQVTQAKAGGTSNGTTKK